MRLLALRYCGSATLMSPKVVCQQSFFTLAMDLPVLTNGLRRFLHLPGGPGLHGPLSHAAYLFDQTHLGPIGLFQVAPGVFYHGQQCR